MSLKGLANVFINGAKYLKNTRSIKQVVPNLKQMNSIINQGVRKEGGTLSYILYKLGFWGGFMLPGGVFWSPITGATGAFTGSIFTTGGKQGIKLAKKCISIFS